MLMTGGFVSTPVLSKTVHAEDGGKAGLHGPLRYLYLRKHQDEQGVLDEDRQKTVFVANIPLGTSGVSLRKFFTKFGPVEAVEVSILGTATTETRVAHVTFETRKAAAACLQVGGKARRKDLGIMTIIADLNPEKRKANSVSFDRWLGAYGRAHPSSEELRAEAVNVIGEFDQEEGERKAADQEMHNAPDEDGWVKVTGSADRRGRNTDGDGITVHAASKGGVARAAKKSKTSNQVVDFYRFQQREKKREHIATLRRKFEQDKERLARMRSSRTFKPLVN